MSNTIPNSLDPKKPLNLINFQGCEKLARTSYPTWKFAIENILDGYGLLHFIHGTQPPPPTTLEIIDKTKPKSSPQTVPNPAFNIWRRQDRLVMGALVGTIPSSIDGLVVQEKLSHETWTLFSTTYANPSRAHILQLKDRLSSITKTTQSTTKYLQSIKTCTDQLASMEKPMDPNYESYKPIIDAIRARDTLISFEAFHDKLLHHDLVHKPSHLPQIPSQSLSTKLNLALTTIAHIIN